MWKAGHSDLQFLRPAGLYLLGYGATAAIGIGVLLLGPVIWLVNGSSWAVPICIAASAFLYVILRSYVELVRVIVDMLLPK